jgi:Arc/MetJ family transcription regulator
MGGGQTRQFGQTVAGNGSHQVFNPSAGSIKERENSGIWHNEWVVHQAKIDSVYKKKSLEQQIMKLGIQITEALRNIGVNKQSTQVKVILMDAVRKASDTALNNAWPAAVHLRGLEKNMPVRSRPAGGGDFENGVIVRVKANGNYDIEKRVDDLSPERLAEVRKHMDRTGIRVTVVQDGNISPIDIQELEGARHQAFSISKEPEWELSVLASCRRFNVQEVAKLLNSEVPKPKTFGKDRTGLY